MSSRFDDNSEGQEMLGRNACMRVWTISLNFVSKVILVYRDESLIFIGVSPRDTRSSVTRTNSDRQNVEYKMSNIEVSRSSIKVRHLFACVVLASWSSNVVNVSSSNTTQHALHA